MADELILASATDVVGMDNTKTNIATITNERLLALAPDRQTAVKDFSKKIDLSNSQMITGYGNVPLQKSTDVNGQFLKMMAGTQDDKDIVKMITELSEATNSGKNEIEILAKKPNFIQKLMYLFTGTDPDEKMKIVIKNTYDLITKLQEDMEASLTTLIDRGEDAKVITKSNIETINSLEEYLVAGYLALEDAQNKISQLQTSNNVEDQIYAKSLQSGIRSFEYKLRALEEAKASSIVSATQSITNVENMSTLQMMIQSKSSIIITMFTQMGSNAILNNVTQRILEGDKTMSQMSRAMLEKISQDTANSTVAIAKSFSDGVLDADNIVKCMDIMHKGFEDAVSYYQKFADNRDSELKKIRDAEKRALPILHQAVEYSSAKIEVDKTDQKLTL